MYLCTQSCMFIFQPSSISDPSLRPHKQILHKTGLPQLRQRPAQPYRLNGIFLQLPASHRVALLLDLHHLLKLKKSLKRKKGRRTKGKMPHSRRGMAPR